MFTLAILVATLSPRAHRRGYLVLEPFLDTRGSLIHSTFMKVLLIEVCGNIALFVPLGFLLPLAVPAFDGWKRIFVSTAVLSACIETLQFLMPIGRVASTTDVMLNSVGGLTGYLLLCTVRSMLPRQPARA